MKRQHEFSVCNEQAANPSADGAFSRRAFLAAAGTAAFGGAALSRSASGQSVRNLLSRFTRVSTQYIAALADPGATAGSNAHTWGLWRLDPGPRGVRVENYARLAAAGGVAPAGWKFDSSDWWFEEHGLIMEQPEFPLPAGKYVVTGGREVTTVLTVDSADPGGAQSWALDDGATIYDVTHLRCRSARYTPGHGACTPDKADMREFPVAPGAVMPSVEGCSKQDYTVLIVIGLEA
jgi:hypothetical protein